MSDYRGFTKKQGVDSNDKKISKTKFDTVSMLKELAKLRGKDEDHYLTDEEKENYKCEYCEVDVDDRKSVLERYDNDCFFQYFYIDDNNHLTDGDVVHDKINYCPMCGRRL